MAEKEKMWKGLGKGRPDPSEAEDRSEYIRLSITLELERYMNSELSKGENLGTIHADIVHALQNCLADILGTVELLATAAPEDFAKVVRRNFEEEIECPHITKFMDGLDELTKSFLEDVMPNRSTENSE